MRQNGTPFGNSRILIGMTLWSSRAVTPLNSRRDAKKGCPVHISVRKKRAAPLQMGPPPPTHVSDRRVMLVFDLLYLMFVGEVGYTTEFLGLIQTLRRRSFTQGGCDAFCDLYGTRKLVPFFSERNCSFFPRAQIGRAATGLLW